MFRVNPIQGSPQLVVLSLSGEIQRGGANGECLSIEPIVLESGGLIERVSNRNQIPQTIIVIASDLELILSIIQRPGHRGQTIEGIVSKRAGEAGWIGLGHQAAPAIIARTGRNVVNRVLASNWPRA